MVNTAVFEVFNFSSSLLFSGVITMIGDYVLKIFVTFIRRPREVEVSGICLSCWRLVDGRHHCFSVHLDSLRHKLHNFRVLAGDVVDLAGVAVDAKQAGF
uniref:Putative metabolic process n=1 Tax=Ixodes ricinus TaxID=34613 RepID=A0A0K8R706_IXORI